MYSERSQAAKCLIPQIQGSAAYWRGREKARSESEAQSDRTREEHRPLPMTGKALGAYAVLGLDDGASKEEAKKAFRRLAQVHHPDRCSPLGGCIDCSRYHNFQEVQ